MPSRRTILTVFVAIMLVTAGCSGADNDDAGAPDGAESGDDMAASADAGHGDADDAERVGSDLSVHNRQLIQSAKLELRVDEFEIASSTIRTIARENGGYVSDSAQERRTVNNESWTTGVVVIRVPTSTFEGAVEDARDAGEVRSAETESDDVTDQLVDVEARLENLYMERDRLRALYDDANETEDVLAVQRELSRVQEEIERLEAQQRSLEDRVAHSTITVHMSEERPEPAEHEPDPAWYDAGVVAAFLDSVGGAATVVRAVVVGFAYVLPYLAVFGTPIAGAFVVYRRLHGPTAAR